MNILTRSMLMAVLAATAPVCFAQQPWQWDTTVGVVAGHMDYRETGYDGSRLDREVGTLPGIGIAVHGRSEAWQVAAAADYFTGDIDYAGRTSSGGTITTRTDTRIVDSRLRLGYRVYSADTWTIDLLGGGGLRWWNRDIRSTAGVSGVREIYRWPYLSAGLAWERQISARDGVSLELSALRSVQPSLEVDFKNGYDTAKVEPQPLTSGRVGLAWRHELGAGKALVVSVWHERWRFAASDREVLRHLGTAVGTVYEPESRTAFTGVGLALQVW